MKKKLCGRCILCRVSHPQMFVVATFFSGIGAVGGMLWATESFGRLWWILLGLVAMGSLFAYWAFMSCCERNRKGRCRWLGSRPPRKQTKQRWAQVDSH